MLLRNLRCDYYGTNKTKKEVDSCKILFEGRRICQFEKVVYLMHKHKAIPRPTIGAFAKATAYKFYNEINQVAMAKGKLSTTLKKENRDTTN